MKLLKNQKLRRFLLLFLFVAGSTANSTAEARPNPAPVQAGSRADSVALPLVVVTEGEVPVHQILKGLGLPKRHPATTQAPAALAKQALAWLAAQGYYFARIDTAEKRSRPEPHIFLRVREGKAFRLNRVIVQQDDATQVKRGVRDLQRSREPERLQQAIDAVLTELGNSGFPFAKVHIDSVFLTGDPATEGTYGIALNIDPGQQVVIDSIRIEGNAITRESVILRELPLQRGDLFKEAFVEEIPRRLMRLGYFNSVAEPELYVHADGHTGILAISVVEGRSNMFNGVAGYNPGTESEPGYLTGLLDLKFGNLLGTGRQVIARWEKRSRETQELQLRYREPWLLGYPLHLEGGFQQLIQDTLYVERRWDVQAEWPFVESMSLVGQLSQDSVIPDSNGIELFGLPNSKSTAAGLGLRYESTDDPFNPSRGAVYHTLFETIGKETAAIDTVVAANSFSQQRLTVDALWYQPLWQFHVLAIGLHWRQITSSEDYIPISDQFRFGGATTLRGYREDQFRGSRVFWANFEYRYLLSRRSRVFVFFDLGYYFRDEPAPVGKVEDFPRSFGLGVRIETGLGLIGIDYGLGEGDGLGEGKVHVSLVNTF